MPSTYTPSLRFTLQATGEGLNVWGVILNSGVFSLVDYSIAGRAAFSLSGSKTLTSNNGATDEARAAMLDITGGTGGTITIPAVSKIYLVRNGASGNVVITTGGGATITIRPGESLLVFTDGTDVRSTFSTDFMGNRITNVGTPINSADAATKNYVDTTAWNLNTGILPGQGGNAGNFLTTNGSVASWQQIQVANVNGAAPLNAPAFTGGASIAGGLSLTGGFTVTGGVDQSGSSKANVQAIPVLDIDLSSADFFTKSISTNSAFTFSNATASRGQAFVVQLTITSSAVPSWPASVKYSNGFNPSASLGNGVHTLGFITFDGGTTWLLVVVSRAQA